MTDNSDLNIYVDKMIIKLEKVELIFLSLNNISD